MAKPIAVSDRSFAEEVLKSDVPVLVDFWADWCGPCRIVSPIVEDIAGEFSGRLKVAKVDVDANPLVAGTYGIRSIPTLLFIRNGQVVDRVVGAAPKSILKARVEGVLAKRSAAAGS